MCILEYNIISIFLKRNCNFQVSKGKRKDSNRMNAVWVCAWVRVCVPSSYARLGPRRLEPHRSESRCTYYYRRCSLKTTHTVPNVQFKFWNTKPPSAATYDHNHTLPFHFDAVLWTSNIHFNCFFFVFPFSSSIKSTLIHLHQFSVAIKRLNRYLRIVFVWCSCVFGWIFIRKKWMRKTEKELWDWRKWNAVQIVHRFRFIYFQLKCYGSFNFETQFTFRACT